MWISLINEGSWNVFRKACLLPESLSAGEEMFLIFWGSTENWKMLGIKWTATIQVCVKLHALFFCWNVETWENIFFVHLAKVGEWKQHGMHAGPQSSMSGMCWREPETRPNPHSRLQRIQAPAYMQKKSLHVHNHPRKLLMLLQNIQKVDSIYPVMEKSISGEVQQWVSTPVCKTRWRLCHSLRLLFSQWCWESCSGWWTN